MRAGRGEEFENKSIEGQPSLGKAVDNSIVFIMDDNLLPKKVFELDNDALQQIPKFCVY